MPSQGHQVLRLRCGGAWLGWPAGLVREIVAYQVPTPLPRAPAHIAGLVALDGRVVTVLDLVPLLELDSDAAPPQRLVVVDLGGESVALLAQEVSGVQSVTASEDGAGNLQGNAVLSSVTAQVGEAQSSLIWCLHAEAVNRLARERT